MASTEAVTMLVLQCRAATIPATSSISFMVTPKKMGLIFVRYPKDHYQTVSIMNSLVGGGKDAAVAEGLKIIKENSNKKSAL